MPSKARVIGYIPLDRGLRAKSRVSKLLDVTRAKDDADRVKKLAIAVKAFNHHDKDTHDADIKSGAISIVCNVLRSCSPFFIAKSKEVQHLCKILLQLLRCNEDRARAAFCLDGSALITVLLEVIEINYRLGRKGDVKCLVLVQNVFEKLIHLARVPLTMVKRHNELLICLINYINGVTGKLAMYHSIRCIATLSEHTLNKQAVLTFPNLMASVEICARHMCEAVRQEAAKTIFHLTMATKNKTQLTHTSKSSWMDVVLTLTADRERSVQAKIYAINALSHLATENENKIVMVRHNDGFLIASLLRIASDVGLKTSSSKLSQQAAKLLGALTCRATASRIGNHPGLLVTFSALACRQDQLASVAAMTIKKLATHIRSNDPCHARLLQALITISYGKSTEVLKWAVKAFAEQASFPNDRVKMISQRGLLPALTMLIDDKNNVVRGYAEVALSAMAADVAKIKDMEIGKLLSLVMANKPCKQAPQRRCYSPTSVLDFAFFDD
mmetsp:Transcript_15502/g.32613  ORF Transcript_15502/g.32613 Transcript_15502/m.32613 type:complete len:500 (+) Transcript_15502:151-1650(+)|eukprot:CAMPEP_0171349836 /NCGR_PEP_ID=MMETSP0878-20121228/34864_1 /TAXON_ID=67004 /ORGANISM="Thalassiosira weissflogii, Strain CCMP1336" /LENGTH=499 /DNA_ID=CAMNT_0011854603 /DNA_START=74 /DNA_END=1573 /DNA_ORIENTATION=-